MADVKRLLDEASELPWGVEWPQKERATLAYIIREHETGPQVANAPRAEDAYLIAEAVNHLPDYEAAVDALGVLLEAVDDLVIEGRVPAIELGADKWHSPLDDPTGCVGRFVHEVGNARAALRRLRGES